MRTSKSPGAAGLVAGEPATTSAAALAAISFYRSFASGKTEALE